MLQPKPFVSNVAKPLLFDRPQSLVEQMIQNVEKVIIGKRDCIEKAMIAFLCGGHILLEDLPGVGKTTLIRALAQTIGCGFKRIQFTPDLLPSDVTGVSIYNPKTMEFEFRPGPLMTHIVLADEINRTSPRTQAALLEAMEEGQITVDGVTYPLPQPFLLMATQNPSGYEGTFHLPEVQLDRFMIRLQLGYPDERQEADMLARSRELHTPGPLHAVISGTELLELQKEVRGVHVEDSIRHYIVGLASATRRHSGIAAGASPRASIGLMRSAQAKAWMDGRTYVIPDDVKSMVAPIWSHRLISQNDGRLSVRLAEDILEYIVRRVPVPHLQRGNER